jgi:ornithine decarboxylase
MAAHHSSAMQDLSSKFGAPPDEVPELLERIAEKGAEPALAFNVGSAVTDPEAYAGAMELAAGVLQKLSFRVRLLDIGGGFPKSYPGFAVPPLEHYFGRIAALRDSLPLAADGEILGEPGRALAAPGLSAVVEVLLRKNDRLYLNDGMYGIFWELRFRGHDRYPVKAYRDGAELPGTERSYQMYGPTCDGTDVLPGRVDLPADIRPGDYLEFGNIGAYSLSGRTNFNGHYSDDIVVITEGQPVA